MILFLDVLEHVDDDVGLLKEYLAKVPNGGHLLITVPAFNFLWSGHDDFQKHKRRYTLGQLEEVLRSTGLLVKQGGYFFGIVFAIAVSLTINGKSAKSQLTRHHPVINKALLLA